MDTNYLLQMLQQSGQVPSQEPDPSQFQSAQGQQPPSAPAYSDMADLQSQQSEQQPQRVTQPPPSKLKQMLMGMMHGMGEAARVDAGMGNDTDNAYKRSLTQHTNAQTDQMGQMVILPNGVQMPYSIAIKAFPAMIGAQSRENVAAGKNDTKRTISTNTLNSQESRVADTNASKETIAGGHDATRVKVAQINGSYGLQRVAARKAAVAQDEPAQVDAWLEAVGNGMPLDKVPLAGGMRGKVLVQAKMAGQQVKFSKLPANQQRMSDSITDIGAALDDGLQVLEPHKTENSVGDYGNALMEGAKYRMGIATDDPLYKQINKIGNFVKIIGATPYTQIGRGKYLFEEIQKHLPQPGKDTPQLMYEKMQTLHTLFGQMQDTIEKGSWKQMGGAKGGGGPKVGDKKTFPNGKTGTWDGSGWAAD